MAAFRRLADERFFECLLVVITIAVAALLYHIDGYRASVLSLAFLPVVLSGFFLGRYRAGVLALLGTVLVSGVVAVKLPTLSESPLLVGLEVTLWAAVLGLTAILVGTLSDEHEAKTNELHEAYVGVVDVLSHYLQRASTQLNERSARVARLSQRVAEEAGLSPKEVDDIRVASLLQDMGTLEITTKIIRKAVNSLEGDSRPLDECTFDGRELVQALGSVLRGALPILLHQDLCILEATDIATGRREPSAPIGAEVIRLVRAYDEVLHGDLSRAPEEIVQDLREASVFQYKPKLLDALQRVAAASRRTNGQRKAALAAGSL